MTATIEMLTILEIIKRTTEYFTGRGIDSARLNAELLVGHALQRKRMQLYMEFERPLSEAELERIRPLVRRRAQHEPLQYILGQTEFHGLTLNVDRRVLIPRPETELLVERVITLVDPGVKRILDLGTGSGAIALALAQAFPQATVVAVDRSADALAVAAANVEKCGLGDRVSLRQSSWYEAIPSGERFGLVVANPPYLSAEETAETALEVRGFEPVSALTAAEGGMADLRAIIQGAPQALDAGGLLALETGITQHAELLGMLAQGGFIRSQSLPDLTGRDRFIVGWRP